MKSITNNSDFTQPELVRLPARRFALHSQMLCVI